MPEDKKAKKATRRLLDIDVDEVSVVDNPAIEETFIVIKNTDRKASRLLEQNTKKNAEIAMGPRIKAAMEAKGMTLEQLAEATAIALEKLKTVVEGTENLSEEELGKVATALDVEKFDDPAEKQDEQAPPGEKPEGEGMEGEGEGEGEMDPKTQMLHEKLNALISVTSEVAAILADMGALQQKAEEGGEKPAEDTASEQRSEHLNPESSVNKAIKELTAALTKLKDDLTQQGEADKKVEKAAEHESPPQLDITKHPDVIEMRKQIEDLHKKLEGFEKSGITKSLSDDDAAPTSVKKQEDKLSWSFFGDDFKD